LPAASEKHAGEVVQARETSTDQLALGNGARDDDMQVANITVDGEPFGEGETLPIGLTKPGTRGKTYSEQREAHWAYSDTDFMSSPPPNPPLHATCGGHEMATDIDAQGFRSPFLQLPPENAPYPNKYGRTGSIASPTNESLNSWPNIDSTDWQSTPNALSTWNDMAAIEFNELNIHAATFPISPKGECRPLYSRSEDDISDERFARIERLWPTRRSCPPRLIHSLWRHVIAYRADNLFLSTNKSEKCLTPHSESSCDSRWGLDPECRQRLADYCGSLSEPRRRLSAAVYSKNAKDSQITSGSTSSSSSSRSSASDDSPDVSFPSREVLDMGLDFYFRRFHVLMPFIHQPTFTANLAPSSLILPMCMIGLTILDSEGAKTFVSVHFASTVEKCRAELARSAVRPCEPLEMLTALACSVLLLGLAKMSPERAHDESTHLLYLEAISMAQRHGLFKLQDGEGLDIARLRAGQNNEGFWKTWARVESAKRLVVCLITVDSFFAHILVTNPVIEAETICFILPCAATLFEAPTAESWVEAGSAGAPIITPLLGMRTGLDVHPPIVSGFGMHSILAIIWLCISQARHRLLQGSLPIEPGPTPTPCEVYAKDSEAKSIGPLLVNVFERYSQAFHSNNPNYVILWHSMCMSLTVDLRVIEIAAGRGGADWARTAMHRVSLWTQSHMARRACIHAAQIFLIMSRRKISDGTMFHSEIALFNSALVLGLYILMMPQDGTDTVSTQSDSFELLDDIDWKSIGSEGLTPTNTDDVSACSRAANFIRKGGPISFSGITQRGGYSSARRIFLDYVGLLEDVGKWNLHKYCRILRIMGDTCLESNGMGQD
jgi:hypothetical protein